MSFVALLLSLAQATAPAQAPTPTPKPPPSGPFVAIEVTQGHASLGTIVIALNKEKAPVSVENFLQYVRDGHYDGTVFHRVMPNFMIQGGGYTPELVEKPTRPPIHNEAKNGLRNLRGTVSMARTNDANSATSQFFINVRDNHSLDFGIRGAGYAVFGEVVEGLDVADKISTMPTTTRPLRSATSTDTSPGENAPQTSVVIKKAHLLESWTPPAPSPTPTPGPAPPNP